MSRRHAGTVPYPFRLETLIGVLLAGVAGLFVAILQVALSTTRFQATITTPMRTASETTAVWFETRDGTVFKTAIDELQDRASAAFRQCIGSDLSPTRLRGCEAVFARQPIANDFYAATPVALRCAGDDRVTIGMTIKAIPGGRGETALDVRSPASAFQRDLKQLDPSRQHVFFLVRGDSFAVFHAARRVARSLGYRTGWEPFDRTASLGAGCDGSNSGFRPDPQ